MKKLIILLIPFLFVDCSKVPITGRRQLKLIPSSEVQGLSADQYSEVLRTSQVVTGTPESKMVNDVGVKIKDAVEKYLKDNGHAELIEGYNWEFSLINSDQINAWAMPGGKVAFYTGIMPICEDETGVAVVMGHEVAHAIAGHGNERMSHGLVNQMGGVALAVALEDKPAETQALFMTAYGLGSEVGVMLPFSRQHESEADKLGLYFMAMAGYDPRAAPKFWEKMSSSGGSKPPEFLSTHPSDATRIKNLNEWMPEALKYYQPSGQ